MSGRISDVYGLIQPVCWCWKLVNIRFDSFTFRSFFGNMKTHVFKVEMTCEGCAKAITNVLNKYKDQGVEKFLVDLKSTTVEIESTLNVEQLQDILKKTGKTVSYLEEKK